MNIGEIVRYVPTATVGKVVSIRDDWVQLDVTGLYYKAGFLTPADVADYNPIPYTEREAKSSLEEIEKVKEMEEEVDIRDLMPSGGG